MKINVSAKKWQTATSKRSWMKLAAHIASHYPKDKELHAAVRGMFKNTDAAVSRYGSSATKKRSTSKPRRAAKRRSAPKRRSTAKRRAPDHAPQPGTASAGLILENPTSRPLATWSSGVCALRLRGRSGRGHPARGATDPQIDVERAGH